MLKIGDCVCDEIICNDYDHFKLLYIVSRKAKPDTFIFAISSVSVLTKLHWLALYT